MKYLVIALRTENFQHAMIDSHRAYLAQLRQDGLLELRGAFTDNSGGAYLLNAGSLAEAQAIAHQDPFYSSGSSALTVYEWDAQV